MVIEIPIGVEASLQCGPGGPGALEIKTGPNTLMVWLSAENVRDLIQDLSGNPVPSVPGAPLPGVDILAILCRDGTATLAIGDQGGQYRYELSAEQVATILEGLEGK